MRTKQPLTVLAALAAFTAVGFAQEPSADEIHQRAIHRCAVEAVIWGMPIVNFDRMLQAATQNSGTTNQVIYWSQPVNWKNQTLTPNPDTIYLNPFYDTRSGPVVLEIPPVGNDGVIVGTVDNAWQNAIEDVGPAGADKGKGGKYLITPPGYKDKAPKGYIVLPSETYLGFAILRSNFKSRSEADIAAAVAYGKRIKVYPLSAGPKAASYLDVYDKPFDATIPYDWHFFESLHRMVQIEPWLTRDKVMIDLLRTIGIEKGKPFTPDATVKAIFDQAAKEARDEINLQYEANFALPFYDGTHWGVPVSPETIHGMGTSFADPNSYPVLGRGVMYSIAYFSMKTLGAGQYYILAIQDKAGQPFKGGQTYRLAVPANAPVNQYWSVTAYRRDTHTLIAETARSSRAANAPELEKNADGSVDIYFGPAAPAGEESNWVPTAGRDFELLFRFYGPKKELFEKTWKLPDVEPVK